MEGLLGKILIVDDDENICEVIKMYLETTGYYPLSPGIYNFTLSLSGATSISRTLSNVSLIPGEFETLYVVGVLNGEPEVGYILTRDGRQA